MCKILTKDERTNSNRSAKQSNHAKLGNVNASKELLQGTRIDQTTCVDRRVCHEQDVVAPCEIEQSQADSRKAHY